MPLFIWCGVFTLFVVSYRVYGRRMKAIWDVDASRITPAHASFDGVDYVPAKNWLMLFGHHFASIAGAGPVVGPVIACAFWGWLPAVLWIVVGSIFIGGVHDVSALMLSVRHGGVSVAQIAEQVISPRARELFLCFVWLTLVLIVAVFIIFSAKTYVDQPNIVIPSVGLIGVAIIVGQMLYRFKMDQIPATAIGLVILIALMVIGHKFPIDLGEHALTIWMVFLIVYAFFASVTPVHVLLQPRDYLSSFLLFFGITAGVIGLFITRPEFTVPVYTGASSPIGPVWPMLFVTVACGAISGFHALVSSGTTAKQMANERYAMRIGYGGMLIEGLVALLALIAIAAGLRGQAHIQEFITANNPVGAFGYGFGTLTRPLLGSFGSLIAITLLNAFVLTTLDTAARIGRYLSEELFRIKNKWIATAVLILVAGWLALSGEWKRLWPTFGASNQLMGALTLMVIMSFLLSRKKPFVHIMIPAGIMLLTACGALAYNFPKYILAQNYFLCACTLLLLALSCFMVIETVSAVRRFRGRASSITNSCK